MVVGIRLNIRRTWNIDEAMRAITPLSVAIIVMLAPYQVYGFTGGSSKLLGCVDANFDGDFFIDESHGHLPP